VSTRAVLQRPTTERTERRWSMSRSRSGVEASRAFYSVCGMSERLNSERRGARASRMNHSRTMMMMSAYRFGESKVAERVGPSNLDHERVDWTPLAVRATCVMDIAIEHCPMPFRRRAVTAAIPIRSATWAVRSQRGPAACWDAFVPCTPSSGYGESPVARRTRPLGDTHRRSAGGSQLARRSDNRR
jgi:hypothetical protein